LEENFITNLVFEKNYVLENGKIISRIWVEELGVGFSNKNHWNSIFDFFNTNMSALELFYFEYEAYIQDLETNY
jgi:hypothetical protein